MITAAKANSLTPTEVKLFEENLATLKEDYKQNNMLPLSSLFPILGRPPIIPNSTDVDAMLDGYNARAEYGHKVKQIEQALVQSLD